MANLKGVIVVVGTVVAAVGVYYGLNSAMPKKEEAPVVAVTASPDEVFGKSIDESAPPPKPKEAPPNAAPASEMAKTTEVAPPPAEANAPAAAPAQETKPAETAAATPPPAPPPSQPESKPENTTASSSQLLVPEPAMNPAPAAKPAPAPKAEPPAPKPTPAPETTTAAAKPAPAPAPKPTPAPAAKPAPTTTASAAPKATPDVPARWWGDPKEQDPRRLNLSYAGQAAGGKGIALLFTGTFVSAGVANWIKVSDASGKAAGGHWEIGSSPKMLVYKGMTPGKYTVTLAPDLKDAQGKILGRKLSGAVTVQ